MIDIIPAEELKALKKYPAEGMFQILPSNRENLHKWSMKAHLIDLQLENTLSLLFTIKVFLFRERTENVNYLGKVINVWIKGKLLMYYPRVNPWEINIFESHSSVISLSITKSIEFYYQSRTITLFWWLFQPFICRRTWRDPLLVYWECYFSDFP